MSLSARVDDKVSALREAVEKIREINLGAIRGDLSKWKTGGEKDDNGPLAHALGHLKGEIAGLRRGARTVTEDVVIALGEGGLSQAAIARVFGVHQSTVSRWMVRPPEED